MKGTGVRIPLALAAGVVVAAYTPPAHRWYLTWGTTPGEAAGHLPGDELLVPAELQSTRAISIAAPPSAVWPWLVQMGSGRGGAYTYDWIENLFGLDMHSADVILPQCQQLDAGDVLPLGSNGPAMRVEICRPAQTLAFRSVDGRWVWGFHLFPEDGGTRLVSRNRIAVPRNAWASRILARVVMEPGSLIMERRMLLGIKHRAEHTGNTTTLEEVSPCESATS